MSSNGSIFEQRRSLRDLVEIVISDDDDDDEDDDDDDDNDDDDDDEGEEMVAGPRRDRSQRGRRRTPRCSCTPPTPCSGRSGT